MKRVSILIFIAAALFMVACNSYLDINTNPNAPTSLTPNLVLPQALTATSFVLNGYNTYGSQLGGYASNAGGYGGFNEFVTYSYTTSSWGLWSPTYDNLEDYQYIINQTAKSPLDIYFNAVATIMRVHNFQLLVDTYNDVPYSHALKGASDLSPAYDKGSDIYPALAIELDSAMARINRGNAMATKNPLGSYDVVFHGDMSQWLQFANTLKLKLIIRGTNTSGTKVTFANTSFDPAGFLAGDAFINPGFVRDNNRQNPAWNNWVFGYTGSAANKAWVPTLWILSWFDGTNLTDKGRGGATFFEFGKVSAATNPAGSGITNGTYTGVKLTGGTGQGTVDIVVAAGAVKSIDYTNTRGYSAADVLTTDKFGGLNAGIAITVTTVVGSDAIGNRLGKETVDAPKCPTGSRWYAGFDRGGTSSGNAVGVIKGPNAGYPLFTAAESYFLQAEAIATGISIPGGLTDLQAFQNGVKASFAFLYTQADGTVVGSPSNDAITYMTVTNVGNHLADYATASGAGKIEAIITQKYIALNYIHSHEGFNEYRRTGYPLVATTGRTATNTFASSVSNSTRPDGLPARIMYPTSEAQYNPTNLPAGIEPFNHLIFWAK